MSDSSCTIVYLGDEDDQIRKLFLTEDRLSTVDLIILSSFGDTFYPANHGDVSIILVDLDFLIHQPFSEASLLLKHQFNPSLYVMTGSFSTKVLELMLQLGFDIFVNKPLTRDIFMALIQKAKEKEKTTTSGII